MKAEDIRWKQPFYNYLIALTLLEEAVKIHQETGLNELETEGLIQRFEFTHELAWNVMKDFFEFQGSTNLAGSRDTTREDVNKGIIENGEIWMDMIKSRNLSSHTYDEQSAKILKDKITNDYFACFLDLKRKLLLRYEG